MKQEKIGPVTIFSLVAIAILVDLIQFLLTLTVLGAVFSWFLTPLVWIVFFIWFQLLGVQYITNKGGGKLFTSLSAIVVELVPFINALPATTTGVAILIYQHNKEVRKKEKKNAPFLTRQVGKRRIGRGSPASDNAPAAGEQREAA